MEKITIIFAFLVLFSVGAHAETRSCQQVQELARELGCGNLVPYSAPTATPATDFMVNSNYGPTQCKTADALKLALKELHEECNAWLKQQKSEMGAKYQSGVCNDDCNDCGMSLRNCSVHGNVHYSK
jgi:hypothetical protein